MQGSHKARPEMGVGEKSTDGELGQILPARASLGTLVVCTRLAGIVLDLQASKT